MHRKYKNRTEKANFHRQKIDSNPLFSLSLHLPLIENEKFQAKIFDRFLYEIPVSVVFQHLNQTHGHR